MLLVAVGFAVALSACLSSEAPSSRGTTTSVSPSAGTIDDVPTNRALCQQYAKTVDLSQERLDTWLWAYLDANDLDHHMELYAALVADYAYELTDISLDQYIGADQHLQATLDNFQSELSGPLGRMTSTAPVPQLIDIFALHEQSLARLCRNSGLPYPASLEKATIGQDDNTSLLARYQIEDTVCSSYEMIIDRQYRVASSEFNYVPRAELHAWVAISAIQNDILPSQLETLYSPESARGRYSDLRERIRILGDALQQLADGGGAVETARESGIHAAATMDMLKISALCEQAGLPFPEAHKAIVWPFEMT